MPFSYITIMVSFVADIYLFGTSFNFTAIVGIILTSSGLFGKYLIEKMENQKIASSEERAK
jgi:drug/metabolite transporter (DMT)-like permease